MKPILFQRFLPVGCLTVLLALGTLGCAPEASSTADGGQQPGTQDPSPYDLRGLTIDPGPNEPSIYPEPTREERIHLERAVASATLPENPRMIAEWEPVQGALIRYPLGISVDAVKTIASELPVYVLCSSSSQSSASSAFRNGGVNMANITFITAATDTYWTRDYAAWWVECGPAGNRTVAPVDVIYRANGVRPNDDRVPAVLASHFNLPTYYPLSYVCQGGNVMTDALKAGASTDRILDETPSQTLGQMQQKAKATCGLDPYHVMEDPAYPEDYIKHIDCWAKFIPGNKVLVKRVPSSSSFYQRFEAAASAWSSRTNAAGQRYTVIRIDGNDSSPYVNHVILNDRVLVPLVGNTTLDSKAISQIQAAYGSSYRVVGVKAASGLPWLGTDSIHCRVNAIPVLKSQGGGDEPPAPAGNLALNKPATASGTYSTSYPASAAVDGSTSTRWVSPYLSYSNRTQWLAVDLGSAQAVKRVKLVWSSTNYPRAWSLQYQSGATWYTAYSTTSGSGGIQEFTFPVATARDWRILATSNASSYYTLYELELFKD
ncbi:MAG: Peptidylarginine deiminase precursor [Acidobacteria bacterium ADurb.Bin340]|nr:MAG: Peptidylarginine deiminase precursor [Acidobacteria bacterium ADurb.Bin340]